MKKVLVAVDGTGDAAGVLPMLGNLVRGPETVVLLHVEQLEGNAMMTGMLGDPEISTLKESLKQTTHKEMLDARAERVLAYCKKRLGNNGFPEVKTLVRLGQPSEEILKVAEEEKVDLIIVGCAGKSKVRRFFTGCTSRDIEKNAKVPVLVAKGAGCGKHAHQLSGEEAYVLR